MRELASPLIREGGATVRRGGLGVAGARAGRRRIRAPQHGRITAGLRGKKAALLTMFGFCVVLGYFLWGETLFPSRHGGRFE